ncbi:hypothetical protein V5O48_004216 [Marasmius crinis-equi]|uniref:AAA+ ATPase domain-containing protein n=1 Tax=Marasmius crinis-equi TaxID=585013 RepID=A0ABR3FQR3_9AGAR
MSSKDHYTQCAEIWDQNNNRWMSFDPKNVPPVHESLAWFCVTARYNDRWSEPYHVLTHFAEPLSTFVNTICKSYGSWVRPTDFQGSQPNVIEMGQALRTLKQSKTKLDEIRKRKSLNGEKKLALVRSLGNIAVDSRTSEGDLDTYLNDMEKQLEVFVSYLETKFKPIAERLANAIRYGYMEFDLLPYYFEPGQEVWYTPQGQESLAMKISQVQVHADFALDHNGVDWFESFGSEDDDNEVGNGIYIEGHGYSWNGACFAIRPLKGACRIFSGRKEISTLPIQLMTPEKREELTARGRRYKAEAGINYKIWRGERVVIDQIGYCDAQKFNANNSPDNNDGSYDMRRQHRDSPRNSSWHRASTSKYPWNYSAPAPCPPPKVRGSWCGTPIPVPALNSLPTAPGAPLLENTTGPQIADDLLCFLPTTLFGFHLGKKEWQPFDLDGVKPVEFDGRAWEHLVLDKDVKTLIKGLVEVSTKTTAASGALVNDVITRKGGGLTSVLYGPPGTGKTLTAEAIAELLKRPLFTVGSSDLPRDPSGMEDTLKYVLQLATSWDAVVLIDEADVFLEQRSLHEIERNALVSAALRVLEYHRGVVFLTTNRIKVFDEAFLSRFSIAVKYPELNQNGRYLIWSRFLELAGYKIVESPFITNDDLNHEKVIPRKSIEALAAKNFNGRTIKNLVRTAQALALSTNSPLKMEHVHIVVRAQEKFLEDFAVERGPPGPLNWN